MLLRLSLGCSAALLLVATGCSRPTSAADDAESAARAILADAPTEFSAFLTWAEQELQQSPDAVALPDHPTLAEPKWPVQRLLDDLSAFKRADQRSDWVAKQEETAPLAEIGPFRNDQPSNSLQVKLQKAANEDGGDAIRMDMSGFDVRREHVGAIELRLHVPFGEKVTLKWGKAGETIILLKSTTEPFSFRILADGLAEWVGELTSIALLTDEVGSSPITVEYIRFLPRVDAFPLPMAPQRVRLGRDVRSSLYMHAPGQIVYPPIEVPPSGKLTVSLGAMARDASQENANVNFQAFVVDGDQETVILDEEAQSGAGWSDVSASLADWAGKTVSLGLRCESDTPDTLGFWGNPTIYEPQDDAPLVIVYLVDTLAAEHMDLYGYSRPTTPFIRTLAQRGAWFANMFSNSSRTVESIPDLMLSMTTERHGVYHNLTPAPRKLVTLAEALHAAGFATASFVTNVYAGPRAHMDQGFDTFIDKIGFWWSEEAEVADRTVPIEEAAAWVNAHRDRPMFMYIHTAEPHAPYTPPDGFANRFDPGYQGSFDGQYLPRSFHNARNPRDIQHIAALYDEEVSYADARIGQFWKALSEQQVAGRANIIITSDHGEEFLQHATWEHGMDLHNEQTRVPLVMYGPLFGNAGRIDTPAQIIDIMPTLLDLFAVPPPYELNGRSLLPLLRGGSGTAVAQASSASGGKPASDTAATTTFTNRAIVSSNYNYLPRQHFIEFKIARDGWKLVYSKNPWMLGGQQTRFKLFDLRADPRERNNLLEMYPDRARELAEELVVWRAMQRPYADVQMAEQDAEQMAILKAQGYVGGDHQNDETDGD